MEKEGGVHAFLRKVNREENQQQKSKLLIQLAEVTEGEAS